MDINKNNSQFVFFYKIYKYIMKKKLVTKILSILFKLHLNYILYNLFIFFLNSIKWFFDQ